MYPAFLSVLVATIITMITAGVEAKEHVVNEVVTEVSFREGFLAVTNIIFAYRKFEPAVAITANEFYFYLHLATNELTPRS